PPPIRELNAEVPERLAAIIAKLMAKASADRYRTAAEVAGVLQQHLAELQGRRDTGEGHPVAPPTVPLRWQSRRWAWTAAALATAAVAALLLAPILFRAPPKDHSIVEPDGKSVVPPEHATRPGPLVLEEVQRFLGPSSIVGDVALSPDGQL